jgi:hypothetical protein
VLKFIEDQERKVFEIKSEMRALIQKGFIVDKKTQSTVDKARLKICELVCHRLNDNLYSIGHAQADQPHSFKVDTRVFPWDCECSIPRIYGYPCKHVLKMLSARDPLGELGVLAKLFNKQLLLQEMLGCLESVQQVSYVNLSEIGENLEVKIKAPSFVRWGSTKE